MKQTRKVQNTSRAFLKISDFWCETPTFSVPSVCITEDFSNWLHFWQYLLVQTYEILLLNYRKPKPWSFQPLIMLTMELWTFPLIYDKIYGSGKWKYIHTCTLAASETRDGNFLWNKASIPALKHCYQSMPYWNRALNSRQSFS